MPVLQKDTQIANRCGLNIRIYDANDLANLYQTIDYANITNVELSGDTVFATGGQNHGNRVGFYNKMVGEMTIQTQILTHNLMLLMSGEDPGSGDLSPVVFKNKLFDQSRIFSIIADTVWKDKNGNVYGEQLIFHRVKPRIAYRRGYSGEGEVVSTDIVFDLMMDDAGKIISREGEYVVVAHSLLAKNGTVTEDGLWELLEAGSVESETLKLNG